MIDLLTPGASRADPFRGQRRHDGQGEAGGSGQTGLAWRLSGAGPVTVVLESGLGASSVGWSTVATELGAVAPVLRYDRLGLGASGTGAGRGRDLGSLADDLLSVVGSAGLRE